MSLRNWLKPKDVFPKGKLNKNVNTKRQVDQDKDKIDSESDAGRNCDIKELAFVGYWGDDDLVEEEDVDYIGDGWFWNKWEDIGDNDEIFGPKEDDH